jgi:hypothetical protein
MKEGCNECPSFKFAIVKDNEPNELRLMLFGVVESLFKYINFVLVFMTTFICPVIIF